jgi:hypothetical protein
MHKYSHMISRKYGFFFYTKSDCDAKVDRQAATWLNVITTKFACDTMFKILWMSFPWFRIQYYNSL